MEFEFLKCQLVISCWLKLVSWVSSLIVPRICFIVPWIQVAHAGVGAGDDEAAVGVVRGGFLVVRSMREVPQRLLMQLEFLEGHFCTSFLPANGHTSPIDRLPTWKTRMDRYHVGTNHVRTRMPGFNRPFANRKTIPAALPYSAGEREPACPRTSLSRRSGESA